MFSIALQRNNSHNINLDKDITQIVMVSGALRDGTSIIDPQFLIEIPLEDVKNCNYCTVDTFGRSYFVTNIESVRTGLVLITCHVDVLTSFKNEIRANAAIIKKQENNWNLYLNDGTFHVYQNSTVTTHPFPAGFTSLHYILAIAGD